MSVLDIGAAEYHADLTGTVPTLSASNIKTLLYKSPAHAWHDHPKLNPEFKRDHDDRFDLGTIVHSLLLEDDASGIEIVDAPDWRTKIAKEAREWAREYGRIAVLAHQWQDIAKAVDGIKRNLAGLEVTPPVFVDGQPEQSIVWEENGVRCRALIDWWHTDQATVDDLKTTERSANPDGWTRQTLFGIGADIQAAFYMRGVKAVSGVMPQFRFVVAETQPPYAVAVVALGPDVLELANRKIDYALGVWKTCLQSDVWPSYPTTVCWANLPPWEENRWLERELREEAA